MKGASVKPDINMGLELKWPRNSLPNRFGYKPIINDRIIVQYSFPMNTESDTQGFRRHKVFFDKFDTCPPIAVSYTHLTLPTNREV